MTESQFAINTEFNEHGNAVHLALLTPTMIPWVHVGRNQVLAPTIKLTAAQARELAAELVHYADVAEQGLL